MNERDALLRLLCEHPEDNTARLVFADWCDEHDDPLLARYLRLVALPEKETPKKETPRKPTQKTFFERVLSCIYGG